jgi:hypothetical protein
VRGLRALQIKWQYGACIRKEDYGQPEKQKKKKTKNKKIHIKTAKSIFVYFDEERHLGGIWEDNHGTRSPRHPMSTTSAKQGPSTRTQ